MRIDKKEVVFITKENYESAKVKGKLDLENNVYLISDSPKRDALNCDLRVNQIKYMHWFMCQSNGEQITMSWLSCGVPDGADMYDYISIARDENMYKEICELFQKLVSDNGWKY